MVYQNDHRLKFYLNTNFFKKENDTFQRRRVPVSFAVFQEAVTLSDKSCHNKKINTYAPLNYLALQYNHLHARRSLETKKLKKFLIWEFPYRSLLTCLFHYYLRCVILSQTETLQSSFLFN